MAKKKRQPNRYVAILESIFLSKYSSGTTKIKFLRTEFEECVVSLGIEQPKNLSDIIYSFRYRSKLPKTITSCTPEGYEWTIVGAGRGAYCFTLKRLSRVEPREDLITIKIPDATPEIISAYAQGDEQALLAKVRYNRLVDVFLGVTAFSLQNHLRSTVEEIGQIEIDELYVAVDKTGKQYIVPIQAKRGKDKSGVVQTMQDLAWCRDKMPNLICRPVTVQFMERDKIAMFELIEQDDEIKIVDEKHYRLVSSSDISENDLATYRNLSGNGYGR